MVSDSLFVHSRKGKTFSKEIKPSVSGGRMLLSVPSAFKSMRRTQFEERVKVRMKGQSRTLAVFLSVLLASGQFPVYASEEASFAPSAETDAGQNTESSCEPAFNAEETSDDQAESESPDQSSSEVSIPSSSGLRTIYEWKMHKKELENLLAANPSNKAEVEAAIQTADQKLSDLEPVTLYRLYNPNSGEHFYTMSAKERDYLVSVGWKDEGIGWYSPKTGEPVYRVYNANGGEHHYTRNAAERDALVKAGWKNEGTGWYSLNEQDEYAVPVLRQYNPNAFACNHNYTTNVREDSMLWEQGWKREDTGWYAVLPVSKVYDPDSGYTAFCMYDNSTLQKLTGWQQILNNFYYLDPAKDGQMVTGLRNVPSRSDSSRTIEQYFDGRGRLHAGMTQVEGTYSYRYYDFSSRELKKSQRLVLPSWYSYDGDSRRAVYDIDASGDVVEGTPVFAAYNQPSNSHSQMQFRHKDGSVVSMPLWDAIKMLGTTKRAEQMMNVALQYETWPYVWGGRQPSQGGFDCSGLVCYAITHGLNKPVSATAEGIYDRYVDHISYKEAKPGDLFFFYGDFNGRKNFIYHVGIYLGNGYGYESNGCVTFCHAGPGLRYGRIR